ncbi:hypothetical protein Dimus_009338 [Dionaea muscipula]
MRSNVLGDQTLLPLQFYWYTLSNCLAFSIQDTAPFITNKFTRHLALLPNQNMQTRYSVGMYYIHLGNHPEPTLQYSQPGINNTCTGGSFQMHEEQRKGFKTLD